jgi:predicted PolB exonuclease-like 3'-5' exonuclease
MNVLAFDIETIPDVAGGRRIHGLDGLSDEDVARVMFAKRREDTGNDFLPVHLQRVAAISAVLRTGDTFKVWSLGTPDSSEKELITRFYEGIERYTPTLVSWNGSGFDLPVLHYRSLVHGVPAARYWDAGDDDRDFRYNNYLNRYHYRHSDVMDILSAYQARCYAPLEQVARLLGLPGKMGVDGSKVWDYYCAGKIEEIRDYCETDALNTYLIYLRWELVRGHLTETHWRQEIELVREFLGQQAAPHWQAFLAAWQA